MLYINSWTPLINNTRKTLNDQELWSKYSKCSLTSNILITNKRDVRIAIHSLRSIYENEPSITFFYICKLCQLKWTVVRNIVILSLNVFRFSQQYYNIHFFWILSFIKTHTYITYTSMSKIMLEFNVHFKKKLKKNIYIYLNLLYIFPSARPSMNVWHFCVFFGITEWSQKKYVWQICHENDIFCYEVLRNVTHKLLL